MEINDKNQNFLGINKNTLDRMFEDKEFADKAYFLLQANEKLNIKDNFDFLNKITKGNGSRAYNKYTFDKIAHSLEYTTAFDYIKHKKMFNLDTDEGTDLHIYRNKNQYHKAPKDFETAKKFIDAGYFIYEGFSPCHNLVKGNNTYKSRKLTLSQTIYLSNHKLLYKPNNFSPMKNISIRGFPGTSFEGCQFIYNYDTGKLVTDNINRGTWDYGKYATIMHFILDFYPWLKFGNGDNLEKPEMFIMSKNEENLYFTQDALNKIKENKQKMPLLMNEKSVVYEYNLFLRWAKTNTDAIVIKGKDELTNLTTNLTKSKEEFIDSEYIKNCEKRYNNGLTSNIDMAYKDAWFDYVSFVTYLENREITKGLDNEIAYIDTNPISLKSLVSDSKEKDKYGELLFKSAFNILKPEEKTVGNKVLTKLPIGMTVYFTDEVKNDIIDVKNKLGITEAINQVHFYRDAIVTEFNKRIACFNFEVRFSGDLIDFEKDFDHFGLEICQIRRVSESEATILNFQVLSSNAKRFIKNNDDITNPDSNTEELIMPRDPEYYSGEAIGLLSASLIGFGIITLLVGAGKIIIDKSKEKNVKALAKTIGDYLNKELSKEYDQIKDIDKKLKSKIINSKAINTIAQYDTYGTYNIYESNDFIKKEDYIHNRSLEILNLIKISESYDRFIELLNRNSYKGILIDGKIAEQVFKDKSLIDELVKFESGSNNIDQISRINYVETLIAETHNKIAQLIKPLVESEKNIEYFIEDSQKSINWDRIGKQSIDDQLQFRLGYICKTLIDCSKIDKDLMNLIKIV